MADEKEPGTLRQDEAVERVTRGILGAKAGSNQGQTGHNIGDFVAGRTSVGKTEAVQALRAWLEQHLCGIDCNGCTGVPNRSACDLFPKNVIVRHGADGKPHVAVLDLTGDPTGYQGFGQDTPERHLMNFGVREGADGKLIFDLNDFDEKGR